MDVSSDSRSQKDSVMSKNASFNLSDVYIVIELGILRDVELHDRKWSVETNIVSSFWMSPSYQTKTSATT
eukprot:UN15317